MVFEINDAKINSIATLQLQIGLFVFLYFLLLMEKLTGCQKGLISKVILVVYLVNLVGNHQTYTNYYLIQGSHADTYLNYLFAPIRSSLYCKFQLGGLVNLIMSQSGLLQPLVENPKIIPCVGIFQLVVAARYFYKGP